MSCFPKLWNKASTIQAKCERVVSWPSPSVTLRMAQFAEMILNTVSRVAGAVTWNHGRSTAMLRAKPVPETTRDPCQISAGPGQGQKEKQEKIVPLLRTMGSYPG